jgi:hypothetical protein
MEINKNLVKYSVQKAREFEFSESSENPEKSLEIEDVEEPVKIVEETTLQLTNEKSFEVLDCPEIPENYQIPEKPTKKVTKTVSFWSKWVFCKTVSSP